MTPLDLFYNEETQLYFCAPEEWFNVINEHRLPYSWTTIEYIGTIGTLYDGVHDEFVPWQVRDLFALITASFAGVQYISQLEKYKEEIS